MKGRGAATMSQFKVSWAFPERKSTATLCIYLTTTARVYSSKHGWSLVISLLVARDNTSCTSNQSIFSPVLLLLLSLNVSKQARKTYIVIKFFVFAQVAQKDSL